MDFRYARDSSTHRSDEQRALRESRQARYRATLAIYENEMEITRREIDFRQKQYEIARELANRTARLHREGIISWLENNTRELEASKLAVDLEQLAKQIDTGRLKVNPAHERGTAPRDRVEARG